MGIICYFTVQALYWFFDGHRIIEAIADCLLLGCSTFVTVAPSFLSTLVIPRKIIQSSIWSNELLNNDSYAVNSMCIDSLPSNSFTDDSDRSSDALRQVLVDETKFKLFIHWMYKEFNAENALCFIEMVQFNQLMFDYFRNVAQTIS